MRPVAGEIAVLAVQLRIVLLDHLAIDGVELHVGALEIGARALIEPHLVEVIGLAVDPWACALTQTSSPIVALF